MYSHIHSDVLEGPIRNPIQQEEVVGRALRESVCSLPSLYPSIQRGGLSMVYD